VSLIAGEIRNDSKKMVYFCHFEVNETHFSNMLEPAAKRSLVLFPGALGDFLCFLPTLRVLSEGQQVDLLAHSEFADLVPKAVKVRCLECYEIHRLFVSQSSEEERLRDFFGSYSSIFSWMGSGQGTFIEELNAVSQGRARVFPFRPLHAGAHQADYYLACVGKQSLGVGILEIPVEPEAVAWSERFRRQHSLFGRPVMALAPGSGARGKNWPVDYFRAVADWWRRRTSGAVIVILGPVEEEKGEYTDLCQETVVARNLNLGQLAALLVGCDLYLGNDSGVSHLAAGLNVITAVLFGPSDFVQWAPRGKHVTVITQSVECAPCTVAAMKGCGHRRCLTTLEPEYVIGKLDALAHAVTLTRGGVRIRVNSEIPPPN
jgi:ADP-heptose:LPS heptosyltransferase